MKTTITDPKVLRMFSFSSDEAFIISPDGHLFKPGDKAMLTGLEDFAEYNGQIVEITNIREDGPYGKAYYIVGSINRFLNWTYEYRLRRMV